MNLTICTKVEKPIWIAVELSVDLESDEAARRRSQPSRKSLRRSYEGGPIPKPDVPLGSTNGIVLPITAAGSTRWLFGSSGIRSSSS
jgi:hypothetical protein